MDKGKIGNTYHISTNNKISILDLVNLICKKMNYNLDDLILISEDRLGKDQNYFLDSSKLRKQTGWKDNISIDEGIDKVITWVLDNKKYLNNFHTKYIHKK
jgi:dTDP-glucose 4,6-dehydratase